MTKSGGYLIEQSVHNLDLCNWVIGAHPLRACGFGAIVLYKNDPPGRTIFDCGSITYDYPNGVKMSFTQNVFHPASMPQRQSVRLRVRHKGRGGSDDRAPCILPGEARNRWYWRPSSRKTNSRTLRHSTNPIVHGAPPPVDVKGGATAALTAILGHEAMVQEKVVKWSDFGIDL